MENQVLAEEKPVNKNRTIIIVAVVAVVLVCCCVIAGIAGFYAFTAIRSEKVSPTQASEAVTTQAVATQEVTPQEVTPQSDVNTPNTGVGDPPSGGLGNDVLRRDTWNTIAPAAVGRGCDQPNGADSTIEVLQQPDAGIWVEKWTVACNSGETYAFEVEFILDATGATFNIKSLP